ncbi:MAG: dihydroorotate dehydrogenase (quinone) [unclassified Hahellaceae]|nr:dihydroorotate dehydrogenase (quinone) [Hahellaceae bacterium]|tara:strand:- start:22622 stop:23674 length:1053 start_codon:yes stop_codon:yes gene_type:complete
MYPWMKNFLFRLDAEQSHDKALAGLRFMQRTGLLKRLARGSVAGQAGVVTVMGLEFPNRVGLAAGLDKDGECIDAFGSLGFGFIEVGTVTPKPQVGSEKPRMFRLEDRQAIINRMGFNNRGVEKLVSRLEVRKWPGIVGVNIGKNKDTPAESAHVDYLDCFRAVHHVADYVTINLSSPNTPGLRALQFGAALDQLLETMKAEQARLEKQSGRYVPLALKIAPDLTQEEVQSVAEQAHRAGIDALIATNTTLSRQGVETAQHAREIGGLSGAPLTARADELLHWLVTALKSVNSEMPVIASGGIMTPSDAEAKLKAGAALVQVYTGFIYAGPALVEAIADLNLGQPVNRAA